MGKVQIKRLNPSNYLKKHCQTPGIKIKTLKGMELNP
jgi:hypothetical protein